MDLVMPRPGDLLTLAGEATDDFEVAGVTLRYIATSGSGETYRFHEGTVSPTLHRLDDKVLRFLKSIYRSHQEIQC